MNEINERPRKKLNFLTPKECFLQKHFVILHLLVEFAGYLLVLFYVKNIIFMKNPIKFLQY